MINVIGKDDRLHFIRGIGFPGIYGKMKKSDL